MRKSRKLRLYRLCHSHFWEVFSDILAGVFLVIMLVGIYAMMVLLG